MFHKRQSNYGRLSRRIVQVAILLIITLLGVDYGKHVVLKRALENEIRQSEGLISFDSMAVATWPLLDNHLVINNFHVNISGTPLAAKTVIIRQGWKEWGIAHIKATDVSSDDVVTVQEAQGMLDTALLNTCVKVTELNLREIHVTLPLIAFSGKQASFDFLYEMPTHHLDLKADAPEMVFPNGASFGLSGQGVIHTNAPVQGKMDVKIKNIDKMMKELVAVGVINESQAGLVTSGSDFLSKIGLHDVTLPLKIEDGEVTLGPVQLFKVGKN
jgi:hypothetical protein